MSTDRPKRPDYATITALVAAVHLGDEHRAIANARRAAEQIGYVELVVELASLVNELGVRAHGEDWPRALEAAHLELVVDLGAADDERDDGDRPEG